MAATLESIGDLAKHPGFVRRVAASIAKAAIAVGTEQPEDNQRSMARRALSENVAGDPEGLARQFAWLVAANPVITAESPDADIDYTVSTVWDVRAGAEPPVLGGQ